SGDRPRYDGDRPKRSFDDRPRRYDGDRLARAAGDRSQKPHGDRPRRHDGERPGRPAGDRPRYDGDRPKRSHDDAPRRSFDDRPRRYDGDRPARAAGDRSQKPYGDRPRRYDGDRPARPADDRPRYDGGRPKRSFDDRPRRHDGERPARQGSDRPYGLSGRPARSDDGRSSRYGNDHPQRNYDGDRGPRREDNRPRRQEQASDRPRDPFVPDEVTAFDLHPSARNELKTLSKENADNVARHLAMAAQLIDEDPALAHEHALAASRRAGRIAIVRETLAITAYGVGDFALALRELRTYRRISGKDDQIALMVDSERGIGRPDRALEEGRSVDRSTLDVGVRVALAIAMSGARLDRGERELALGELEIPELDPNRAYEWSPALFAARAAVLDDLGRHEEAAFWTHRAAVAGEALGYGGDEELLIEDMQLDDDLADADADADAETADETVETSSGATDESSDEPGEQK
ncbi:primosomal protein, partial [Microbacterium keratanolyticum]|uniref:primosomal protein n=2 Tax=Microbacterium keratanolyticum TaxID=67574 RepID=UPI0036359FD7